MSRRSRSRPSSSCTGSRSNTSGASSLTPMPAERSLPRQTASPRSVRRRSRTACASANTRAVEAVQVELEGLALDDVGRFAGNGEVRDGQLRLAARVEPAQFEGGPEVGAEEGQGARSRCPWPRAAWRARSETAGWGRTGRRRPTRGPVATARGVVEAHGRSRESEKRNDVCSRISTTCGGRSWPMPGIGDERAPAMRRAVSCPQAMGTSGSASPCSTSAGLGCARDGRAVAVGGDRRHLAHQAGRPVGSAHGAREPFAQPRCRPADRPGSAISRTKPRLCATSAASSRAGGRRIRAAATSGRGPGKPRAPLELMMLTRLATRSGARGGQALGDHAAHRGADHVRMRTPRASSTPSASFAMSCRV